MFTFYTFLLLVFSAMPFETDQNKNQSHLRDTVQNLGKERKINMQRLLPRSRSQQFFTQIYRDLYRDAMLVPIQMGTSMAAGNPSRHSKTLK